MDVGTNANPTLETRFANTPEYAWMQQNAGKYGFELSFPENNRQGINFEPWHWRFVGSEQAQQIFASAAGSHTVQNHGSTSTPSDPQHNLRQYLARIALGESSGGTNIGPHPRTQAYGEYQFVPETRQIILERYGLDAWSTNKAERDQAAVALIQAFGDEIGTDILGLIEAGEFEQADQLLGQHVYSRGGNVHRYGQFTSLPGGAEQHDIWKDPAILAQYGPNGNAGQNPLLAAINTNSQRCNPTLLASADTGNAVAGPEGDGVFTGTLRNPLPGATITSEFGYRQDPIDGTTSFHEGIDLAQPGNPPILAADGGVVDFSGWNRYGYGNLVIIYHGDGLATWYGHNQKNTVVANQNVSSGQQIGLQGSTGKSTGPHVDFGVLEGYQRGNPYSGNPVNPRKYVQF